MFQLHGEPSPTIGWAIDRVSERDDLSAVSVEYKTSSGHARQSPHTLRQGRVNLKDNGPHFPFAHGAARKEAPRRGGLRVGHL